MKVHRDITEALDERSMTTLIMHDLSAAFDVIDHPILLKRLAFSLGFKGKALTWLKSYIVNRTQFVSEADKTPPDLVSGVSHGFVLGPRNY